MQSIALCSCFLMMGQATSDGRQPVHDSPPLATQMFEAGSNCTPWPLSVPSLRLNCAFIAPPRLGEDREAWVKAMRAYRQALRTGKDHFGLRMHPGSFDRRHYTQPPFDADMTM